MEKPKTESGGAVEARRPWRPGDTAIGVELVRVLRAEGGRRRAAGEPPGVTIIELFRMAKYCATNGEPACPKLHRYVAKFFPNGKITYGDEYKRVLKAMKQAITRLRRRGIVKRSETGGYELTS